MLLLLLLLLPKIDFGGASRIIHLTRVFKISTEHVIKSDSKDGGLERVEYAESTRARTTPNLLSGLFIIYIPRRISLTYDIRFDLKC